MTQEEFEKCIKNKDWYCEDEKGEWYKSYGEEQFIKIGNKLVEKGFTYGQALDILGACHGAVAEEFGC